MATVQATKSYFLPFIITRNNINVTLIKIMIRWCQTTWLEDLKEELKRNRLVCFIITKITARATQQPRNTVFMFIFCSVYKWNISTKINTNTDKFTKQTFTTPWLNLWATKFSDHSFWQNIIQCIFNTVAKKRTMNTMCPGSHLKHHRNPSLTRKMSWVLIYNHMIVMINFSFPQSARVQLWSTIPQQTINTWSLSFWSWNRG